MVGVHLQIDQNVDLIFTDEFHDDRHQGNESDAKYEQSSSIFL